MAFSVNVKTDGSFAALIILPSSGNGRGEDLVHLGQGADGREEPGQQHHHAGPLVLGAVRDRPQDRRQSGSR